MRAAERTDGHAGDLVETVDVVVVGAGISGLAVTRSLHAAGVGVMVLERRSRPGGRLFSHRADDGAALDLGATWFWPGEARVSRLVDELGLASHQQHIAGRAMYHDHTGARRLDGNPIDVPSYRFSDGAQGLAIAIAAELPVDTVRYDTIVDRVDRPHIAGPLRVRCRTVGEEGVEGRRTPLVEARHVVLAVPPALAVDAIEFVPGLPDRLAGLASITPVWMGSMVKVVARFERPFWREQGLSGSAISHVGPLREVHDMSGPGGEPAAVFGFAPTRAGEAPPSERAIVDQLVTIFGPDAAAPLEVVIADWRDPATLPPGGERLDAYQTFGHDLYQQPALAGRLHWTSTETARRSPGHIEGALDAADRTVRAILDDLAPDPPRPAPTHGGASVTP